jgi:hypothetical protein
MLLIQGGIFKTEVFILDRNDKSFEILVNIISKITGVGL